MCDWSYVSFSFQATTRCSSSLLEPPPSPSEKQWPLATTSVTFYKTKKYFTARTELCRIFIFFTVLCAYNDCNLYAWPAVKNLRGEYYLNGHWVIEFSRATPIAGTMLYYQRGAEGDNIPETIIGRGPTTEPLVVEVRWNILQITFVFHAFIFFFFDNYVTPNLYLKRL